MQRCLRVLQDNARLFHPIKIGAAAVHSGGCQKGMEEDLEQLGYRQWLEESGIDDGDDKELIKRFLKTSAGEERCRSMHPPKN